MTDLATAEPTPVEPTPPADAPMLLTSADVATLARITYRQLDYWTRTALLRPVDGTPGSGHGRVWPLVELAVACRMSLLVGLGVNPRKAAQVAREGGWL